MKLAIVCDDLIQKGGAEKIVEALSDIFPEAPIYTSIASKEWLRKFGNKNRTVITSFLQKFPFSVKLNRFYAPFYSYFAIESLISRSRCCLFFQDLLILRLQSRDKHLCYMCCPAGCFGSPLIILKRKFV